MQLFHISLTLFRQSVLFCTSIKIFTSFKLCLKGVSREGSRMSSIGITNEHNMLCNINMGWNALQGICRLIYRMTTIEKTKQNSIFTFFYLQCQNITTRRVRMKFRCIVLWHWSYVLISKLFWDWPGPLFMQHWH